MVHKMSRLDAAYFNWMDFHVLDNRVMNGIFWPVVIDNGKIVGAEIEETPAGGAAGESKKQ